MTEVANIGTRAITCPGCGGSLDIRAAGYTVTLVCEYCRSILDTAHPDVRLIARFEQEQAALEIPLGTRGTLRGVEWQAIGHLRRSGGGAYWEEYLLFNPYHGYRWLVTKDGRWSFGTMLTAKPEVERVIIVDEKAYRLFYNRSIAKVDRVLGEFYWRVKVGESVDTVDYVRPGVMLSMEENETEQNWTLNEFLQPREIKAAFPGVTTHRWYPGGTPAPHEPSPVASLFKPCRNIAIVATMLLFVSSCGQQSPKFLDRYEIPAIMEQPETTHSYGPIRLTDAWQGITVRTQTPAIDQGWADIDMAFVDRRTQESYEVYSLNEYYHGADADGPWSEGADAQTVRVASLPAGTYDLTIDTSAHVWTGAAGSWNSATGNYEVETNPNLTISVLVYKGAVFYQNFWLALALIVLPFLGLWWTQYMFDKARFDDMDGSPDLDDWLAGYAAP